MRPADFDLYHQLEKELLLFDRNIRQLPGISNPANRDSLIEQLLESIRRIKFIYVIRASDVSEHRADPNDETMFDPIRASVYLYHQDLEDEAFWQVFLSVHFGKHARAGWRYAREVYGRISGELRWDWASTSADPVGFREWLAAHQSELKREGVPRGFGNHRKYQSLDAFSATGTGATINSYIEWIRPPRTHGEFMQEMYQRSNGDPMATFDLLYQSMDSVVGFGRIARFDYLTMLSKLGLAEIEPGSAYLVGTIGPTSGARLLFGGNKSAALSIKDLNNWVVELEAELSVGPVGMQVMEDAMCNWQKSPGRFIPFRG